MNLNEQKNSGINEVHISDSLQGPLLRLVVKADDNTTTPISEKLIIGVDKVSNGMMSGERRTYSFELDHPLYHLGEVSDEFVMEFDVQDNDVVLKTYVRRQVGLESTGYYWLNATYLENIVNEYPIILFEGNNYISTNYNNAIIEVEYSKNDDLNNYFLNKGLFYLHKLREEENKILTLDDIYFKDAFTKDIDKLNLEVDNACVDSLSSKNNKFSLDSEGNLIVNSITTVQNPTSNNGVCDLVYPIGSIYMSVSAVSPSTLFGGVWEQLKDKFLLGSGDIYVAGSVGGESSHVLTTNELPSHNHNFSQTSCSDPGNHTHVVGADKDGGAGTNRYTVHITSNNTANGAQHTPISGAAGSHTHAIGGSISNTGSNVAHNNMPPYLTVYMWKRVS